MSEDHPRAVRVGDVIVHVVWELTLACDLGCVHCGSRAGSARDGELTTEECLRVVEEFRQAGVRYITLIGGEAYLREDWLTIVRAITDAGITCGMTTGAFSWSPEMVAAASEAGLVDISISIDGIGQVHDMQRGRKGSFDAAVETAHAIARSNISLSVNTQLNRLSIPQLSEIAALLVEVGAVAWQIQLTVPMGNAADRHAMLIQPYDLLELFPLIISIKRMYLGPHQIKLAPANNIGYFGPHESEIRNGQGDNTYWQGCPAGKHTAGLESNGVLKGCPSLETTTFGAERKVTDTPIEDLFDDPVIRQLQGRSVNDLWGYCAECYYASACLGGCSWTAHSVMGRAGNNPYCFHRAEQLERQGIRERLVHVEAAHDRPFATGRFEIVEEPIDVRVPSILDMIERPVSLLKKHTAIDPS